MAFVSGPDNAVRTPEARDSEESRDWAYVRVTKGRGFPLAVSSTSRGVYGSMRSRDDAEKLRGDFVK